MNRLGLRVGRIDAGALPLRDLKVQQGICATKWHPIHDRRDIGPHLERVLEGWAEFGNKAIHPTGLIRLTVGQAIEDLTHGVVERVKHRPRGRVNFENIADRLWTAHRCELRFEFRRFISGGAPTGHKQLLQAGDVRSVRGRRNQRIRWVPDIHRHDGGITRGHRKGIARLGTRSQVVTHECRCTSTDPVLATIG